MTWAEIKHFKPREFDSKDLVGSGINMNLEFVAKLDKVREMVGFPIRVVSGYRTEARNRAVGGVRDSAHRSGRAADLAATSSGTRYKLLTAALAVGFQRVGIGPTFIHLDDDATKPNDVLWLYSE